MVVELLMEFIEARYGKEYTCEDDILLVYHKVVNVKNNDISPSDKELIAKAIKLYVLGERNEPPTDIILALKNGIEDMNDTQNLIMAGRTFPPRAA